LLLLAFFIVNYYSYNLDKNLTLDSGKISDKGTLEVRGIEPYTYRARGKLIHRNTRVLYFDFKMEFGCVGVLVGVLFVCVQKSTGTKPMQLVLCLHYTLQKVSRHVKVKYELRCMCGGWHNSSKHLGETLNSKRNAYKRIPLFRTFG